MSHRPCVLSREVPSFFFFVGNQVLNNQLLKKKLKRILRVAVIVSVLILLLRVEGRALNKKKMNNKIRNLQFDVGV